MEFLIIWLLFGIASAMLARASLRADRAKAQESARRVASSSYEMNGRDEMSRRFAKHGTDAKGCVGD